MFRVKDFRESERARETETERDRERDRDRETERVHSNNFENITSLCVCMYILIDR